MDDLIIPPIEDPVDVATTITTYDPDGTLLTEQPAIYQRRRDPRPEIRAMIEAIEPANVTSLLTTREEIADIKRVFVALVLYLARRAD